MTIYKFFLDYIATKNNEQEAYNLFDWWSCC